MIRVAGIGVEERVVSHLGEPMVERIRTAQLQLQTQIDTCKGLTTTGREYVTHLDNAPNMDHLHLLRENAEQYISIAEQELQVAYAFMDVIREQAELVGMQSPHASLPNVAYGCIALEQRLRATIGLATNSTKRLDAYINSVQDRIDHIIEPPRPYDPRDADE